MGSLEDFIDRFLPLDHESYLTLSSRDGLDGYKLISTYHGNVVLANREGRIIKHLSGDVEREIISELNALNREPHPSMAPIPARQGGSRRRLRRKTNRRRRRSSRSRRYRRK